MHSQSIECEVLNDILLYRVTIEVYEEGLYTHTKLPCVDVSTTLFVPTDLYTNQ